MSSSTVMKQGDLLPALTLTCLDGTTGVDLTAATEVRVRIAASTSAEPIVDAACTKADQTLYPGRVQYEWTAGDTDTAGTYLVEVIVTWPGAKEQTFPAKGYGKLVIADDLAEAVV